MNEMKRLYALLLVSVILGTSLYPMDSKYGDVKAGDRKRFEFVEADERADRKEFEGKEAHPDILLGGEKEIYNVTPEDDELNQRVIAITGGKEPSRSRDKILKPLFQEAFETGLRNAQHSIYGAMTTKGQNEIIEQMPKQPGLAECLFSHCFCSNTLHQIERIVRFIESQENGPARMRRLLLSRTAHDDSVIAGLVFREDALDAMVKFIDLAQKYLRNVPVFLNQTDMNGDTAVDQLVRRLNGMKDAAPREKSTLKLSLNFLLAYPGVEGPHLVLLPDANDAYQNDPDEWALVTRVRALGDKPRISKDKILKLLFEEAFENKFANALHSIFGDMTTVGQNQILAEMPTKQGLAERLLFNCLCCSDLEQIKKIVHFIESQTNPTRIRRLLLGRDPYGQSVIGKLALRGELELVTRFTALAQKYLHNTAVFLNQRSTYGDRDTAISSLIQNLRPVPNDPEDKEGYVAGLTTVLNFLLAQPGIDMGSSLLPALKFGNLKGIKLLAHAIVSKNGQATLGRILLPSDQKNAVLANIVQFQDTRRWADQPAEDGPEVLRFAITLARKSMGLSDFIRFLNQKGDLGRTALMNAMIHLKIKLAIILLNQQGVDTGETDDNGSKARDLNPAFYDRCQREAEKQRIAHEIKRPDIRNPEGAEHAGIADIIAGYAAGTEGKEAESVLFQESDEEEAGNEGDVSGAEAHRADEPGLGL